MPSHLAITHHLTQAEQLSPNKAPPTSSIPNAPHTKGFNNPPCSSKPSLILLSTLPSILLAVILAICVGVFCYMGYRYLDVEFLSFTAGDALPQLLQLERMYQGVLKLNPKIFFAFEFYNYGFLYYVLNLLVASPFIITENYSMQIYAPRVLNALFSIANAWLIYHIASMYISRMKALVLVGIFLAMSGFWHQGYVYKPDVFQAFFVLACAYCVLKDNFAYARYYTLAWVALGLGIGVAKFQAVLFIPMLYAYIAMNIGSFGIYGSALRMIKGTLGCVCLWIITNPYLLHPRGFNAWLSMFLGNMHSNATNHGAWTKVTLGEKLDMLWQYYFIAPILIMLCAMMLICCYVWARQICLQLWSLHNTSKHAQQVSLQISADSIPPSSQAPFQKSSKSIQAPSQASINTSLQASAQEKPYLNTYSPTHSARASLSQGSYAITTPFFSISIPYIITPIALGLAISLLYLFVLVNKAWEAYYFSSMALAMLMLALIANLTARKSGGGGGNTLEGQYLSCYCLYKS